MRKKQNKHLILILLIPLLMIIYCLINSFESNVNEFETRSNISIYRVEQYIMSNITQREILKIDGNILIGTSKKELENGYYDLKICNKVNSLDIYVNKLWKEFDNKLYQEEYVNQIVHSIIEIFEINDKNVKEDLYEYILEGYKVSKELVENSLGSKEKLELGGVELKRNIVNSEMILSISKEVDK